MVVWSCSGTGVLKLEMRGVRGVGGPLEGLTAQSPAGCGSQGPHLRIIKSRAEPSDRALGGAPPLDLTCRPVPSRPPGCRPPRPSTFPQFRPSPPATAGIGSLTAACVPGAGRAFPVRFPPSPSEWPGVILATAVPSADACSHARPALDTESPDRPG